MLTQILVRAGYGRFLALPLLLGCGGTKPEPPYTETFTFPDCLPGQFLSIGFDKSLACTTVRATRPQPPVCPSGTHALNLEGGILVCVEKGMGTTTSEVAAGLSNALTKSAQLAADIQVIQGGTARYCGQTASLFSGRFVSGSLAGIAALNASCAQTVGCGLSAHLCSVYEMYESVALGVINNTTNVNKAWVYMASWSQEFSDASGTQEEPGAGLADNCGGYTSSDTTKKWYGTAVQWASADGGQKALKFFSGPGTVGIPGTTTQVTNPGAVSCDSMLPAVCCR